MSANPFRYEFRSFAQDFGLVESRMRSLGGQPDIRESSEIYLVSGQALDQNIKIRFDQLDLKDLVSEQDGFEQWRPVNKWSFPLHEDGLSHLRQILNLGQAIPASAGAGPDCLVEHLCRQERQVVSVDLFKRRFGFKINDCLVEIADVLINGAAIRTACVESADLVAARTLTTELGLADYSNVNYIRAIARVTGLVRLT